MASMRSSPAPSPSSCTQRPKRKPNSKSFRPFGPLFDAPQRVLDEGQKAPHPLPQPAGGVIILEPLRERPAGPKHTRAELEKRLGRLQRARQELVRVPESNTKYGGNAGKTGGHVPRCWGQVSVSPTGFPSEKICAPSHPTGLSRFSQAKYFCRRRPCLAKTHARLRERPFIRIRTGPVRHAVPPVVRARNRRHGGRRFLKSY